MRNKKYFVILGIVLISITVLFSQPRRSYPVRNAPVGDVDAAKQNVWKEFSSRVSACGGSYYASLSGQELELRGCSPVVRVIKPNTEADRLNGIYWSGQIDIQCSAWRAY